MYHIFVNGHHNLKTLPTSASNGISGFCCFHLAVETTAHHSCARFSWVPFSMLRTLLRSGFSLRFVKEARDNEIVTFARLGAQMLGLIILQLEPAGVAPMVASEIFRATGSGKTNNAPA